MALGRQQRRLADDPKHEGDQRRRDRPPRYHAIRDCPAVAKVDELGGRRANARLFCRKNRGGSEGRQSEGEFNDSRHVQGAAWKGLRCFETIDLGERRSFRQPSKAPGGGGGGEISPLAKSPRPTYERAGRGVATKD